MSLLLLFILLLAAAAMMILERAGVPTTLELSLRGDLKRETGWLAQYGQGVCTLVVAAVIWRLEPSRQRELVAMLGSVAAASLVATLLKRLVGRVRPRRENAGRFLGPSFRHDNARESFPSSHSAAAVALSVALSLMFPAGAPIFWALAIACALLRYLMDAHWPSDVLAGVALGYATAHAVWRCLI
jgi:membrane-associated phospholipid phosphatase